MTIELKAGETKRLDVELAPLAQTGIIQGYVVDAETSEHIPSAAIYLDGEFALYSWTDDVGGYRIAGIPYGTHVITVEANNYETTDFEIMVSQPIQSINLAMPPLPPGPPGEWSDGVEVQKIFAEPETVYLGEIVNLNVYIQYGINDPSTYPTPATIFGTVKVNGQELRAEFDIDFRNPTLRFEYMATQIGEFTAISQGKSCNFVVTEKKVNVYSPFGGERMPVCTAIVIPDVPSFWATKAIANIGWVSVNHPGGDFWIRASDSYPREQGNGFFDLVWDQLLPYADNAYPAEWDIGSVTSWKIYRYRPFDSTYEKIMVFPVVYQCSRYWDGNDKLAKMIASDRIELSRTYGSGYPDEFILEYGEICPRCGGTGIIESAPPKAAACSNCWGHDKYYWKEIGRGLGKVAPHIYTSSGLKNWVKPISIGLESRSHCWIVCPYCGGKVTWIYPWPYSSCNESELAKNLFAHIENSHPEHPLTQPAWF